MIRSLLSFFLVFLFSQALDAKDNWVLNLKGDTLRGKVYFDLRDAFHHDRIAVKENKSKQYLLPSKIIRASINGYEYVPIAYAKKQQFARVSKEGFLSLYLIRGDDVESSDYFIQELLVKKTGAQLLISPISFKTRTLGFLDDCVIDSKIEEAGDYRFKNITAIIDEYNECMEERSSMIYMAKRKEKQLEMEPVVEFGGLLKKVENSSISSKSDLIEMIKDVESKTKSGKKIPAYLSNSIKDILKNDETLLKEFDATLKKLNP